MEHETRTLLGKYQIQRNIYATCFLDVLEADGEALIAHVGVRKRADTEVPAGTRLILMTEQLQKITQRQKQSCDIFYVTVLSTYKDEHGLAVHKCTTVQRETIPERRAKERAEVRVPVHLKGGEELFTMINASTKGLTLEFTSKKAVMRFRLDEVYTVQISHRGKFHEFPIRIKHIQYNWKSHLHTLGVGFESLNWEQETIINLIIDPTYQVKLPESQKIDTGEFKISSLMED